MDLEEIVIMGIVVAIISAVAVIVSAILGDIASSGKLKEFLAGQHSLRSAEHDKLKEQQNNLREQQTEIKNMLTFLKDEKNKELGRIESMRASNLDIEKIINQITAMSVRLSDQEKEIAALKEKNASLEEENNRLLQALIQQYPAASDEDEDEWEM